MFSKDPLFWCFSLILPDRYVVATVPDEARREYFGDFHGTAGMWDAEQTAGILIRGLGFNVRVKQTDDAPHLECGLPIGVWHSYRFAHSEISAFSAAVEGRWRHTVDAFVVPKSRLAPVRSQIYETITKSMNKRETRAERRQKWGF